MCAANTNALVNKHTTQHLTSVFSDNSANTWAKIITSTLGSWQTVISVSGVPKLGHNFLNIILLAGKNIEIFLRKAGQSSKIIVDKEIFDLADMIKNHYVIRLVDTPKPTTINQVTAPRIKTWYVQIEPLEYRFLLKLSKLAKKIEIKGPGPTEICSRYINNPLQRKSFRTAISRATKFLKEMESDLKRLLTSTRWREQYYILVYDVATGIYHSA